MNTFSWNKLFPFITAFEVYRDAPDEHKTEASEDIICSIVFLFYFTKIFFDACDILTYFFGNISSRYLLVQSRQLKQQDSV